MNELRVGSLIIQRHRVARAIRIQCRLRGRPSAVRPGREAHGSTLRRGLTPAGRVTRWLLADETGCRQLSLQRGQFSVSSTGVLGYSHVGTGAWSSQLTWMDRMGRPVGTAGEPGEFFNLDLSPDERRVAVSQHKELTERPGAPFNVDIWLIDLVRAGPAIRLSDHPAREFDPAWSRDGTWIAFNSTRDGGAAFSLFQRRSNRSGDDEPLVRSEDRITSPDWSPDGRHLLYTKHRAATGHGLWTLSLTGRSPALRLSRYKIQRSQRGVLAGRPLDRVRVGRVRTEPGLRAAVSPPRGTIADLARRRVGATMAW